MDSDRQSRNTAKDIHGNELRVGDKVRTTQAYADRYQKGPDSNYGAGVVFEIEEIYYSRYWNEIMASVRNESTSRFNTEISLYEKVE